MRGTASSIDQPTKDLLTTLKVQKTVVVGGTSVVSDGVVRSLSAFGPTRVAGSNRHATSQLLNKQLASTASTAYVATWQAFPDALAGAAVAGSQRAPLNVVRRTCVPSQTRADLLGGSVGRVNLLGGTSVLTDAVKNLKSC